MLDAICDILKFAYKRNWISTRDGNVSYRRIGNDYFYVTPSGVKKQHLNSEMIIKLTLPDLQRVDDESTGGHQKKISGLIAEIVEDGVVIGIGINVGMTLEELPVPTATSLAIEGVSDTSRNEILARVLALFETNFTAWDAGDNSVAQIYASLSSTLGTKVQIHYPNEQIEKGLAVAISPRGELILDSGSHVQAGDVVHLR